MTQVLCYQGELWQVAGCFDIEALVDIVPKEERRQVALHFTFTEGIQNFLVRLVEFLDFGLDQLGKVHRLRHLRVIVD